MNKKDAATSMLTQLMLLIQVECSASSSYSWPFFEMENSAVTEWHLVCTDQYKVVAEYEYYIHHVTTLYH